MELEKKLEDHLNPKKISNSELQESLYRISNYKTKYELYKIFCQDVISSYPESGKLINKIILDFDEIINSLIQEFNKSREKIEKIEKTYKSKD